MMAERQTDPLDYDVDELDELVADRMADPSYRASYEDAAHRAAFLLRLVDHRKACSVSQTQVAERMGTTQSAVSEIEGGISDPRLSTMFRYARAVDLRLRMRLTGHSGQENVCVVFGRAEEPSVPVACDPLRVAAHKKWSPQRQVASVG